MAWLKKKSYTIKCASCECCCQYDKTKFVTEKNNKMHSNRVHTACWHNVHATVASNQMPVLVGVGPQVNKFVRISSLGHQLSLVQTRPVQCDPMHHGQWLHEISLLNRITDTHENITFPQLCWRVVTIFQTHVL